MKLLTNKFFILGNLFLILLAIPVTLFFISRQQETRSRAAASTTLFIDPATTSSTTACTNFTMKVKVDPGQNAVSIIDFTLSYDQTKVTITDIKESSSFTVIRQANLSTPGKASISVSIGDDITKAVQTITDVATITFKPVAATGATPTSVTFDNATKVFSIDTRDSATENVLSTTRLGNIAISESTTCPGQTSIAPTTSLSPTPSPTPSQAIAPLCTALVLDRAATGTAPFAATFTASGTSTNAITKVTFTFGDGQSQDVTQSGGIGTNSVNASISHQYNNAGTFAASAIITDSQNTTSQINSCKLTVTVNSATAGSGGSGGTGGGSAPIATSSPTQAVEPIITATAIPTIPPAGNTTTLFGVIGGIMVTVIGGILLLTL